MALNITIGLTLFSCLLLSITSTVVKIVRDNPNSRSVVNPNINYNDFVGVKTQSSNFSGPPELEYLCGQCFLHSSDKYEFRVCPFENITQRERVWHSGAYKGIIGIWKEWSVQNNSFDGLLYYSGDDCGDGIERNAKLIWICNRDINVINDKIVNISEPNKCFYEIQFASDFGCENKYIYQYLSEELQRKWDLIESNYFYEELTKYGYELALNEVLVESGIVLNTHLNESDWHSVDNQKCLQNYRLLEEENESLKNRIQYLENEMKNKN